MKVFISWSGDRSRSLADEIRAWLPRVLQASQPWMSDVDINSGSRWAASIAKELENANFGIICTTRENMHNPWLLFEAGALSKAISDSHVCPLLLGFGPSELNGPLSQFQAAQSNNEGVFKILTALNRAMPKPLDDVSLSEIFEVWWPRLSARIEAIPATTEEPAPKRSTDEVLADLLELAREHMRRDNLRIEHQKERDQQVEKMHSVMDSLTKSATHVLDMQSGPLALISNLQEKIRSDSANINELLIDPASIEQLAKMAGEVAKNVIANSPVKAIEDFQSIVRTIDARDQQLYTELLDANPPASADHPSDLKN